jgi:hypothetical protein
VLKEFKAKLAQLALKEFKASKARLAPPGLQALKASRAKLVLPGRKDFRVKSALQGHKANKVLLVQLVLREHKDRKAHPLTLKVKLPLLEICHLQATRPMTHTLLLLMAICMFGMAPHGTT